MGALPYAPAALPLTPVTRRHSALAIEASLTREKAEGQPRRPQPGSRARLQAVLSAECGAALQAKADTRLEQRAGDIQRDTNPCRQRTRMCREKRSAELRAVVSAKAGAGGGSGRDWGLVVSPAALNHTHMYTCTHMHTCAHAHTHTPTHRQRADKACYPPGFVTSPSTFLCACHGYELNREVHSECAWDPGAEVSGHWGETSERGRLPLLCSQVQD